MKLLHIVCMSVFILLSCNRIAAQDNIGIKLFGLSVHPKGEEENAFLMPNKLDEHGYLVINVGAELSYEKFFLKDVISFKVVQALYADCAERLAGFSHIGLRHRILKRGNHSLYGGLGPTLVFRRNWLDLPGYINQNRFKGDPGDKYQYLFLWYGGEFEYKVGLSKQLDFGLSFVPGYPDLMSFAFGINYKLN